MKSQEGILFVFPVDHEDRPSMPPANTICECGCFVGSYEGVEGKPKDTTPPVQVSGVIVFPCWLHAPKTTIKSGKRLAMMDFTPPQWGDGLETFKAGYFPIIDMAGSADLEMGLEKIKEGLTKI